MQPRLPPRPPDAHKGTFGHVLVLGGSESMPGAPALTGLAALRSGAGLVTIATSREAQPITAGFSPALMTMPLPSRDGLVATTAEQLDPLLRRADVLVVGPGLGRSPDLQALLASIYRDFAGPMLVDADGLNNLAAARADWGRHAGPRILTPHLGEFSRMSAQPAAVAKTHPHDSAAALELARRFAREHQVVLLLKGPATLVTNGTQTSFNVSGNSGLATAGSGDILSGIIAALWAGWICSSASPAASPTAATAARPAAAGQGRGVAPSAAGSVPGESALTAAVTGTHLHGLAADLAAAELSQTALISSDLPRYLGPAIRQLGGC